MECLGTEEMVEVDSADQTGDTEVAKGLKEVNEADTARLGVKAEMFERQESAASTLSNQSWCESPETCHTWDMQSVVSYIKSYQPQTVRGQTAELMTPDILTLIN